MEDKKNLENNEISGKTENTEELNEELETLAEIFRTELAKTTEEFESVNVDETEVEKEETDSPEDAEISDEPAGEVLVCERCGEVYENGKDGICEKCLADLRNRPFKFVKILCILVIGLLSIVAMRGFWQNAEGYALAYEAKTHFSKGNVTSARTAYDNALAFFNKKGVLARNLYFESAETVFVEMSEGSLSMTEVADRMSRGLDGSILPMPHYAKYKNMGNESLKLYATMQNFYDIVNKPEYASYTVDNDKMYNSIMAEIEALKDSTVEIKTVDGKTQEVKNNEAMVRFCQYMFAYTSGKSEQAQNFLRMVYEAAPEYLWLYAYEYALNCISAGDIETAKNLAEALVETNKEDTDGYSLYSTIARLSGDADKAVEWADKAIEINPQNAENLRLKAMALVVKGDCKQAKAIIDEALQYESYGILYYTSVVVENELGNKDTVEETVSLLQMYGLPVSDSVNSYLEGEITAEQLFTEGSGDVE